MKDDGTVVEVDQEVEPNVTTVVREDGNDSNNEGATKRTTVVV